jgi:hypothetical protein
MMRTRLASKDAREGCERRMRKRLIIQEPSGLLLPVVQVQLRVPLRGDSYLRTVDIIMHRLLTSTRGIDPSLHPGCVGFLFPFSCSGRRRRCAGAKRDRQSDSR